MNVQPLHLLPMSLIDPVTFPDFGSAINFSHWIGGGVIRPQPGREGYYWDPDGTVLNERQRSRYDAYHGIESTWYDEQTGLTWLYRSEGFSFSSRWRSADSEPARVFAGHSDWRASTLAELKTLRSPVQDENGLWRVSALVGKVAPVLTSSTKGFFDRAERRDWDFAKDCSCEDHTPDSKIVWGSSGQFAGFEGGRGTSTGAREILVRGTCSLKLPRWLKAQVEWAEQHRIDDFPVTERTVPNLVELSPYYTYGLPPHIEQLTGLRSLEVASSVDLSAGIYALANLESLTWGTLCEVRRTKGPMHLPAELGNLKQLRKLSVDGPLESLPDSIGELTNLEELTLRCAITALPSSLGRLSNLRKLDVGGAGLRELPRSVDGLSSLVELCVHAKDLRHVPDELGALSSLTRLDLSRCAVERLPASLAQLARLTDLSLRENELAEVPTGICDLVHLARLDLSFNPLAELPVGLGALEKLCWLNLCGLPILEVPAFVRHLSNLECIVLSGTQIQELPAWLWDMPSLRVVSTAGTWRMPRLRGFKHPTIKIDEYSSDLNHPWGRDWLKRMGKPD